MRGRVVRLRISVLSAHLASATEQNVGNRLVFLWEDKIRLTAEKTHKERGLIVTDQRVSLERNKLSLRAEILKESKP